MPAILLVGLLLPTSSAVATDLIQPVTQTRHVKALAIADDWAGNRVEETQFIEAPDFNPFFEVAIANASIPNAAASANGSQDSEILADSVDLIGDFACWADGAASDAEGVSLFEFDFELTEPVNFTLTGHITALDDGATLLSLVQLDGSFHFDRYAFGPSETIAIGEVGLLLPGTYQLRALTRAYITGDAHAAYASGGYEAAFQVAPVATSYCTAKAGLVCGLPSIGFSGLPQAGASAGFEINAQPARGQQLGLVLYTNAGRAAIPFQGGLLCVNPAPLRRSVIVSSGGTNGACDGVFRIDFNAFASGNLGGHPDPFLENPGEPITAQYWGRDSQASGSFLSDGLDFVMN